MENDKYRNGYWLLVSKIVSLGDISFWGISMKEIIFGKYFKMKHLKIFYKKLQVIYLKKRVCEIQTSNCDVVYRADTESY